LFQITACFYFATFASLRETAFYRLIRQVKKTGMLKKQKSVIIFKEVFS